jgi:tryptophan synthase alpha chain
MSRIGETFARLAAEGRAGFAPFIMAGDPSLEMTRELLRAAVDAGADLIELGVPFSDPMADGPALQRSAERALAVGTTLTSVLELVTELRRDSAVPVVLFGYANPFLRYGAERLARDARASGADGILCVDMPPEEADDLQLATDAAGLDMIFLLAPTSDRARLEAVRARARGFVYYVSITGTTGAAPIRGRDHGKASASGRLPVGVGFGSRDRPAAELAHRGCRRGRQRGDASRRGPPGRARPGGARVLRSSPTPSIGSAVRDAPRGRVTARPPSVGSGVYRVVYRKELERRLSSVRAAVTTCASPPSSGCSSSSIAAASSSAMPASDRATCSGSRTSRRTRSACAPWRSEPGIWKRSSPGPAGSTALRSRSRSSTSIFSAAAWARRSARRSPG